MRNMASSKIACGLWPPFDIFLVIYGFILVDCLWIMDLFSLSEDHQRRRLLAVYGTILTGCFRFMATF